MKRLTSIVLLALLLAVLGLCACAGSPADSSGSTGSESASTDVVNTDAQAANKPGSGDSADDQDAERAAAEAEAAEAERAAAEAEADALRIGSMKGPTSVGLAHMMQLEQGEFTVVAAADELTGLLLQDELDIALVPANVAALLYQRTDGQIQVIDVNTLGVLYGVSLDGSISSVEDLYGRTVYMTGKGTVPEYTFAALLEAAGMTAEDVTIQFCSEPAEVAAQIAQHSDAVGILPQPYATAITIKNSDMNIVLDLNEAWIELTGGALGDFVTGVTVAKTATIQEHQAAIDLFLQRHEQSAAAANADPASVAQTVAELGIIESESLAEQAIPRCNVVCLVGNSMKEVLSGYLECLYQQNPESVGALPDDSFYYGCA